MGALGSSPQGGGVRQPYPLLVLSSANLVSRLVLNMTVEIYLTVPKRLLESCWPFDHPVAEPRDWGTLDRMPCC